MLRLGGSSIAIFIKAEPEKLFDRIHELVRMAFPGAEIKTAAEGKKMENYIHLQALRQDKQLSLTGSVKVEGNLTSERKSYQLLEDGIKQEQEIKRKARVFVYLLLCRHTGSNINAYGILTGVRPVKLVHRMLDQGLSRPQTIAKLQGDYLLSADKAALLAEVAFHNRPFLPQADQRLVSVYIGIPLCPSRCYYCSFPGAVLSNYQKDAAPLVRALLQEMKYVGNALRHLGLGVQTIYIGGGTPTILQDGDLGAIFELLHHHYISSSTTEITLEAGRPDTLSLKRLEAFRQAGVNRVCINPQSMNDATLKRIGRRNRSSDIETAVEWARQANITKVNMDLIIGLPGEGAKDFRTTLEKILMLKPENITVHTLAAKKGSDLARNEGQSWQHTPEIKAGMELFSRTLAAHGYQPYYLYRQKYMRTDAENIGYSLPGYYCLYNIQMIEERQSIIGLGGGAASKFITASGRIAPIHNPSDLGTYCNSVAHLSGRKVDNLKALN